MGLNALNAAITLIDENGGDFEGAKDEMLISQAKAQLSLEFPPSYEQFLRTFGCGDIAGIEIYGIINANSDESGVPDAIWLTLKERNNGLPANLIIIASTGDGGYYAIDTSIANGQGENPVILHRADTCQENVAEDFGTFLLTELKTVI